MGTSIFKRFFWLAFNEVGAIGALGGDDGAADDNSNDGDNDNSGDDGNGPSAEKALYGDLEVKWPEGIEEGLRAEASLKSFVNDKGEINVANLAKSFVHTKKQVGMDKAVLPTENSSEDEINEFYEKLGFKADKETYLMENIEESKLDEDYMGRIKDFAHENKLPVEVANKMANFLNAETSEGSKRNAENSTLAIDAGLADLKTEFGQAYDQKLNVAKRVLQEVVKDQEVLKSFDDPAVGSNPAIIKALVKIGETMYAEDGFSGTANSNVYSPEEAQEQINSIMGDPKHPYNNANHASHGDAVKKVMKLFEMKQ